MGRLRSLLASVRAPDGVAESPITSALIANRAVAAPSPALGTPEILPEPRLGEAFVTPQIQNTFDALDITDVPLLQSQRSQGPIHELAETLVTEYMRESVSKDAFRWWVAKARVWRYAHIAAEWSIHATASACLRRWYSESRHRRVAAAAWREALWSALSHAIAVWREHADVLLAASKIDDTLSISAGSLRALAFRRWRSWTCSWRMLHLAQVAHSHMSRKVSFGRWSAFCTHPRSRRVQLRRPGSRNGSTFVSAFHAVAEQHRRQRAFLAALNAWRLTAVRRQLATADRVGIWRPVARRALYTWRVEANGCAWRERAAVQCATSSAFLRLALAMRMWHELAAQQPQVLKRLREERVSLTVTVLSFDRWRRHVDLLLSVTSSGRQQRRALRMPTTAAAAVRAAVVLAQQRAFRMWQLIRYDGLFRGLALTHWTGEQQARALAHWRARTAEWVMRTRMMALGSTMAAVGDHRRALLALHAAARRHTQASCATAMCGRAYLRELREAFALWLRGAGFARHTVFDRLRQCFELAQALVLLFTWRLWANRAHEQRANAVLSATLPFVHALHRWRSRVEHCRASAPLHASLSVSARSARLPPAWQAWRANVQHRHLVASTCVMVARHATRRATLLAMKTLRDAAMYERLGQRGVDNWVGRARRMALHRWNSLVQSNTLRTVASLMPSRERLDSSRRASYFARWVVVHHVSMPWLEVAAHSRTMGRKRMLRDGWASIQSEAASTVTAALALLTITEGRLRGGITCWRSFHIQRGKELAMLSVGATVATATMLRDALARVAVACQARMRRRRAMARAELASRFILTRQAIRRLRRAAQRSTQHSFLQLLGQSTVNRAPPVSTQRPVVRVPPHTPWTAGPMTSVHTPLDKNALGHRGARGVSSITGVTPSPAFLKSVWKRAV